MRRTLFGQRSERTRLLLEQMELTFEECEAAASEDELLAALAAAKTNVAPFERKRPARKPLPEHLPRERVVIAAPEVCPCCGSDRLCKLGEDITETLEVVPRRSEEHTSELQSLMRISYAVFCLKKKNKHTIH